MPRKARPAPSATPSLDWDYSPFDLDVLRDIIATTRLPDTACRTTFLLEAVRLLNGAAVFFKRAQAGRVFPTASEAVRHLEVIKGRAEALRDLLPWEYEDWVIGYELVEADGGDECYHCELPEHFPPNQTCSVCGHNAVCGACKRCRDCTINAASRDAKTDNDKHHRWYSEVQEGLRIIKLRDRQVDLGTLQLVQFEMDNLMEKEADELSHLLRRQLKPEVIFGSKDARSALNTLGELLELLIATCDSASAQWRRDKGGVKPRSPINDFLAEACQIYLQLFKVEGLTYSRAFNTKMPTGPLIRFLDACAQKVLGDAAPKSPEALAAIISDVRNTLKQPRHG